ncbi:hypothetical protein BB559_006049 [Furculomyces boomerangus]|uniref:Target of rapamycin complex subunit LST8 n=2 Tax=Harpellales TaxID=61421 RepID=A0A2T9Y551_9FUNG|nr:hypothetical protein BB559_006049 [Furculomyces boomerangus]PWA00743.1 hypothetical protein BB558_003216 [Smittium angustum]
MPSDPNAYKNREPHKLPDSQQKYMYEDNAVVLVTAGHDHSIRMWDALKSSCTRTIQYNDSQINRIALSPDKRYLAVAGNPHVKLYDVFSPSQNPILILEGHKAAVTAVEFTSDMRYLATSSEDKSIRWWDLRSGSCEHVLEGSHPFNGIAIVPTFRHEFIVSCDQGGHVLLWSIKLKSVLVKILLDSDSSRVPQSVRTVAVSPDGKVIVAANNLGGVFVYKLSISNDLLEQQQTFLKNKASNPDQITPQIFDASSLLDARLITSFNAHDGKYITRSVFSGNGKFLVTCSADKTAKIWRFKTVKISNKLDQTTQNSKNQQISIQPFSPKKTEYIYEIRAELVHTLSYHKSWVWDAAFSNDSGYLVTVSSDKTAALWDVLRGRVIKEFIGHEKGVLCVALNDATT